ncbi:MAG TPA: CARDB domain-containing protein, partial [Gemmatimonadaceae bacterium]
IYAGSPWTLAAGASQTFEVQPNWGYIAVGTHDWTWRLDPDSRVIETDETNNTYVFKATVISPP